MTYIITETSRHSGLQVASLAEVGRESSAIILVFDQHKQDRATAVALLPDGRRFINRALRLDPIEEGHKWDAAARKVEYVFDENYRPDLVEQHLYDDRGNRYETPRSHQELYELVGGKGVGTWYFIGLGEGGKAWRELPRDWSEAKNGARHLHELTRGPAGDHPEIDSKLLRWVEHNLLRFTDVLKVGDQIDVFQNQAYRCGQVVARIGSEILGVFTYKNGRNVLYVWGFRDDGETGWANPIRYFPQYQGLRSVSFNSIPKKWVDELAKLDLDLDAAHILPVGPDAGTDAEHIINFLEEEFSGEDNTI